MQMADNDYTFAINYFQHVAHGRNEKMRNRKTSESAMDQALVRKGAEAFNRDHRAAKISFTTPGIGVR